MAISGRRAHRPAVQQQRAVTQLGGYSLARAWADARARYRIPQLYVEQLLDGVAADLRRRRYDTFAELA